MSGYVQNDGEALWGTPVALSDSNPTTIMTGATGLYLHELQVTNETGSAVGVSLDIHDGSTAWKIAPSKTIDNGGTGKLDWTLVPIPAGHTLRATGASGIQIMFTYIDNTATVT